jgi:CubicO group peptidase (beta-lactamase class C family)
MKHIASAILILLYLSAVAFGDGAMTATDPENLGFSTMRLARIASWYQVHVEAGDLPGAVVAIARNGKLAYLKGIGFQDRSKTIPMNPDAIFWIASMTKPVTSVAAMMLVEEGKLDLDAPVARYLPALEGMQVAREVVDPVTGETTNFMLTQLVPQKHPMTVRDLLRHTSGLVYPPQFKSTGIHRLYGAKGVFTRNTTLAEFVASLGKLPLAHQPGEVWEYSWGVDVLARVVEVASGQPFDQFLQGRIFGPLHMIDTGFYVPPAKLARLVDPPPGGRAALWDVTKPSRLFSGGAGLVSTAPDYLRFCQMLLNGGELDGARILSPATVELMTTNSLPADIRFALNVIGPETGASFGLGFAIRTNPEASQVPGSVGTFTWGGLWGTTFWIDPTEKLIAVLMIQVAPSASGPYQSAFRNLTYGALRVPEVQLSAPLVPVAVGTETLAEYAGKYYFGPGTSSRDQQAPRIGLGVQIAAEHGETHVTKIGDGSPASRAGLLTDDLITEMDGTPIKGLALDQVLNKMRGAAGTKLRLTIQRPGLDRPLELVIVRDVIPDPGVELRVRLETGRLMVESAGLWPILDFEEGQPVAVAAISTTEFYVVDGDHTRIAFVRDADGKVSGAVLNPGPWQQTGVRLD